METNLPFFDQHLIPKKYARLAWLTTEDAVTLHSFRVYLVEGQHDRDRLKHALPRSYSCGGETDSDWDEWKLEDVLLMIFKYPVKDHDEVKAIFRQLGKIEEWAEKLAPFNGFYWEEEEG
jgi:hypothetical protein